MRPVEPDWTALWSPLERDGARCGHHPGVARLPVIDAKPWPLIPAPGVKVVDTVGAGDAFNGALAAALAEGRTFGREVVAWATAAGALAVTQPGAQTALPLREAIDRLAARPDDGLALNLIAECKGPYSWPIASICPVLAVGRLGGVAWVAVAGERMAWRTTGPTGRLHKTRSTVMARQGMAATSQPLATARPSASCSRAATPSTPRSRPTRSWAWSSRCRAGWAATCSRSSGTPRPRSSTA